MDKFRIWISFETGDTHLDTDWCGQEQLLSSLQRLLHGPAARMGIITEIKVVDTMDCIVFLARNNKIVFPNPDATIREQKEAIRSSRKKAQK